MHAAADDACQLVGLLQFKHPIPASGTHAYCDASGSSFYDSVHDILVYCFGF